VQKTARLSQEMDGRMISDERLIDHMVTIQTAWDRSIFQEDEPELHVVAFYEDLRTGEWAKEIFDRIRSRVPRYTNATPGLWRFDVLEDRHLETLAAADAADAAVIIVAARGTRPLPKRLLDCVEKALSQKGPARVGLVAVLEETDQGAKDALPAYRQLQAVSRKAKLRFFSLPCENLTPARSIAGRFEFASNALLENSLSIEIHSYRAWGINE
jgi:hypothetical protein